MKYTMFDTFIAYASIYLIREVELSDVYDSFEYFKTTEKYAPYLLHYDFIDKRSAVLKNEFLISAEKGYCILGTGNAFFTMEKQDKMNIFQSTVNQKQDYMVLIKDFVKFNMENRAVTKKEKIL